jgi:hypothetical protein
VASRRKRRSGQRSGERVVEQRQAHSLSFAAVMFFMVREGNL